MNECSLIISSLNFLFMKRLMIATDQRQHSEDIEKAGLDLARDLCASVDIYTVIDKVADFTEPNTGNKPQGEIAMYNTPHFQDQQASLLS
jgi:hypothetical protein